MRDDLRVYLLRVAEPKDLDRVCDFLRSSHVLVRDEGKRAVSVSVPGASTPLHERREITGCIATWNALNPASPVELLPPD